LKACIIPEKRYPCPRTPVTDVSGLYTERISVAHPGDLDATCRIHKPSRSDNP
jgi:hypothetical protein